MSRVTRPGLLATWAALLFVAGGACGGGQGRPPDLVLIVLDTLRLDLTTVGGGTDARTPFLEEFAAAGTLFEHAYSTSCWTLPAHASMFTGELPDRHGADQMSGHVNDDVPLLAERLRAAGYQTVGFTQNPWVASRSGLDRGFEHMEQAWESAQPAAGGHPVIGALRRWLVGERDARRPLFLFVNLIHPHAPYTPTWQAAQAHFESREAWMQALQRYSSEGPRGLFERHYGRREPLDAGEWERVRALYAAELEQTDELARRLLELIDAGCDPDATLVLIVSDHGENLGDLDHTSHMFSLNEALTRVLCLARGPGFMPGARDARLAQLQDVYPTLLDAAGLDTAAGAGRDLRAAADPGRVLLTRIAFPAIWLETFSEPVRDSAVLAPYRRELWAAQDERYKLVVGSDGSEQLFDLSAPQAETRPLDLGAVAGERLERLRASVAVSRRLGELQRTGAEDPPSWSPEQLEALRALGYAR